MTAGSVEEDLWPGMSRRRRGQSGSFGAREYLS